MSLRRPTFAEGIPGAESHTEVIFRFVAWVQKRRGVPSTAEMMSCWGMSRSTAWRYRRAMFNAGLLQVKR